MSEKQKDPDGKANWAPGELADGSISTMTTDQARAEIIQRDADEAAFDKLFGEDDGEDLDDISDLDDEVDDD